MDSLCKQKLDSVIQEAETWCTTGVFVETYIKNESENGEDKEIIDICVHIGSDSNDPVKATAHSKEFKSRRAHLKTNPNALMKRYFPPEFDLNAVAGRKRVTQHICKLFDSCGGGITATGSSAKGSLEIVFRCFHHRITKANTKDKGDGDSKRTTTTRPRTQEETCPWRFTIYFEPSSPENLLVGRWYFYENGAGCRFHCGHICKQQHEISRRVELLDEDELEITDDGMDVNLSSQSMAMMFMSRTGLAINPKKL